MKKLSLILLVGVSTLMLTGCGATEPKVSTKSCSKQMDGYVNTFKWTATDDKITQVDLSIVYDNSLFNIDTFATISEEDKEQIKANMLENLGLAGTEHKGLDIDITIEDQMTVTLKADLDVASEEDLKKVGMDFKNETNRSFKDAVKASEKDGYTCK